MTLRHLCLKAAGILTLLSVASGAPIQPAAQNNLRVTASRPDSIYVNRLAKVEIRTVNPGKHKIENVVIKFPIPKGAEFEDADNGGANIDGIAVWKLGSLVAGAEKIVTIKFRAPKLPAKQTLTVQANGDNARGQYHFPITFAGLPALRLEVCDSKDPIKVGGQMSYTVKILNLGSVDLTDVRAAVTVPEKMQIVTVKCPAKTKKDGHIITILPIAKITPGQEVACEIIVKALKEGEVHVKVKLYANPLGKRPVNEDEGTTIIKK